MWSADFLHWPLRISAISFWVAPTTEAPRGLDMAEKQFDVENNESADGERAPAE